MTVHRRLAALLLVAVVAASAAQATPKIQRAFGTKYPAAKDSLGVCGTCHTEKLPELNLFGADLKKAGGDFAAVDSLDSDGDGALNEIEILALKSPGDLKAKPASKAKPGAKAAPAAADTAKAGKK